MISIIKSIKVLSKRKILVKQNMSKLKEKVSISLIQLESIHLQNMLVDQKFKIFWEIHQLILTPECSVAPKKSIKKRLSVFIKIEGNLKV